MQEKNPFILNIITIYDFFAGLVMVYFDKVSVIMKKILYMIVTIGFCLIINGQDHVSGQPIYVTVNTTQANQTSSVSHATAFAYTSFKQIVLSCYDSALKESKNAWAALCEHLWQYKCTYMVYSIIAGYVGIMGYVQYINHFMQDKQKWHNWSNGLSMDSLYTIEHSVLSEQLMQAIQNRYFNIEQPTNTISGIVQFFIDLQKERNSIKQYIAFINILKKWYVSKLPGILLPDCMILRQAKRHLDFLEQLIKAWCILHTKL